MNPALGNAMKALSQALAILGIAFLLGMVVHKLHTDVSALAEVHSGEQFWVALGRYFISNLAGGVSSVADIPSDRAPSP